MIRKIISNLSLHRTNAVSLKQGRRILYIESDDWGMLRMRSNDVKSSLIEKGYPINDCIFNSYDRLENNEDVQSLSEVLHSVTDQHGRPGLMILNNIVGNPDFEKIKDSDFNQYYVQPFTITYKQYNDTGRVTTLINEGIRTGCFLPQFHGREHVHINNWMNDLKSKQKTATDGFEAGMFTITSGIGSDCKKEYLDAMSVYTSMDLNTISESISEGLKMFSDTWGFSSVSAIAPCYMWNNDVEAVFYQHQVSVLQSGRAQIIPGVNGNSIKRRSTGEKNVSGQMYTVRNVYFEPSTNKNSDWVDYGLSQIKNAFFWGAPAIINSHRVNYIGSLDPKNRDFGLKSLQKLLAEVKKYWPDVEFVHPFIH